MSSEEARKAAEAKKQQDFLAYVAHELRTPLNGVIGLSQTLVDTEPNKGRQKHLKMIQSCATRLVGIVNMIMDISALRDGKMELHVSEGVSVDDIAEEVYQLMLIAVDKSGKKIKKEGVDLLLQCGGLVGGQLPLLQCDKERVTQIIFNLVNNALKFTPGGFVKICTRDDPSSDSLIISVEDSGKGIKKENLKKIFEPFGQEEEGKGGGLGLGLSIVTKICELHGGNCWVESELGSGSRFFVRLPYKMRAPQIEQIVTQPQSSHASASDFQSGSSQGGRRKRRNRLGKLGSANSARLGSHISGGLGSVASPGSVIPEEGEEESGGLDLSAMLQDDFGEEELVDEAARELKEIGKLVVLFIDKDAEILKMFSEICSESTTRTALNQLTSIPIEVLTAMDGFSALDLIDTLPCLPDVIFVDLDMPGLNGFLFTDELRVLYPPELPVILLMDSNRPAAIRTEAAAHLISGFFTKSTESIKTESARSELIAQIRSFALMHAMSRLDRGKGVGLEILKRNVPAHVLLKLQSGSNLVAESFPSISVVTAVVGDWDKIQCLVSPFQLATVLNKLQSGVDKVLADQVGMGGSFFRVEGGDGEWKFLVGHEGEENHTELALGFGRRLALAGSAVRVGGKPVDLQVGLHAGPLQGVLVGGEGGSAKFIFFGDTIQASWRLAISGVGGHVHCSETVHKIINNEFQGSGIFEFEERGDLGEGEDIIKTYILQQTASQKSFKHSGLNFILSTAQKGKGPGSVGGQGGQWLEGILQEKKDLEMRISLLKGSFTNFDEFENELNLKGVANVRVLMGVTDGVERVINALEGLTKDKVSKSAKQVDPKSAFNSKFGSNFASNLSSVVGNLSNSYSQQAIDALSSLISETEKTLVECNDLQQSARETISRAKLLAAVGSGSDSVKLGLTLDAAEAMGGVLDEVLDKIGNGLGDLVTVSERSSGEGVRVDISRAIAPLQNSVLELENEIADISRVVVGMAQEYERVRGELPGWLLEIDKINIGVTRTLMMGESFTEEERKERTEKNHMLLLEAQVRKLREKLLEDNKIVFSSNNVSASDELASRVELYRSELQTALNKHTKLNMEISTLQSELKEAHRMLREQQRVLRFQANKWI